VDARIMVCSVTEGEDKPLKYPLMFRARELVIINKIDLLPHLDFDIDRLEANIVQVNPAAASMRVSARTGDGVEAFRRWLAGLPTRARAQA
jgi:hydrogenase nickel incorporation protein HypB